MSVQVPKGYKQTEVGVIPEEWNLKTFGQVLSICHGKSQHDVEVEDGPYPILASGGKIGTAKLPLYEYDSVLIGRKGTINKPQFMSSPFWTVDTLFYSKINSGNCAKFIYYLFCSIDWMQHNEASGVPSLNARTIEAIQRGYPLNSEQQVIAEALSDADALIESLEQLIAKKRQIKQGAMQELLTGQRRLPGFGGEWIQQRLGDIAHIKTGGRNNQDKVENGEFPFFVRSATVERINTFTYDCEAILVPGEGGIGSIFHYIFGKFDVHQRVYAITQFSGNVSGKFIYYYMKTYFGRHAMENSVKATVDSLRLPTFQDFAVKIPSSVEEQIEIASILSEMEQELEMLEERLQKAQTIKQSMMQELLTGRIRLI